MPLNTVQHHVKDVLDGLVIPGQPQPLQVWITPPVFEDLDGPRCYVWGGRGNVVRQTMPRGRGFKKLSWLVDIYLVYETNPQDTNAATGSTVDSEFPIIVDSVILALGNAPMTEVMTDPDTGYQSQLLAIGETITLDYPPEKTPATMRMLWYSCLLTTDVIEAIQQ